MSSHSLRRFGKPSACLLFFCACIGGGQAVAQEIDDVLDNVRQAMGTPEAMNDTAYSMEGRARFSGTDAKMRTAFDERGRFLAEIIGPLAITTGFDGQHCWKHDWNGTTQLLEFYDRQEEVLSGAFASSVMFSPESGFEFTMDPEHSTDEQAAIIVNLKGEKRQGRVLIDRQTWLPASLEIVDNDGSTVTLSDYAAVGERKIATKVTTVTHTGLSHVVEFGAPAKLDGDVAERFSYRPEMATNFRFDVAAPADLTLNQAPTGHLLVQVVMANGGADQEPVWFILDTGAGSMVVSSSYAGKLELESFGEVNVQGVGAESSRNAFRQADSLSVGPLTMQEPIFVEIDLDFLEPYMGVPVSGILGFEMFARCVAEVDFAGPSVKLFDAGQYALSSGEEWYDLFFSARHPTIRGTFDGIDGFFKLDTGAAGTSAVFHSPAVKEFNLLQGRETTSQASGGVGGVAQIEVGTLKHFSFAGHNFEDQQVAFATGEDGAFSDDSTTGMIGGVWIRPFTMVLDYPHKRIAFVKREE